MLALAPTFDGRRAVPSPEITRIMLELLQLGPQDKLLEIGTGSGYQTQEFAKTGAEIHTIELEPWVDTTQIVGDCVYLHVGDGRKGLPSFAPFSAIVATCGIEGVPQAWAEQLSEGGRLVAPIGEAAGQRLVLFKKVERDLLPVRVAAYVRFQMMRDRPVPNPTKYQPQGACRND